MEKSYFLFDFEDLGICCKIQHFQRLLPVAIISKIFAENYWYRYSDFWLELCICGSIWVDIGCRSSTAYLLFISESRASLKALSCTIAYARLQEISVITYNSIKSEYHRYIGLESRLNISIRSPRGRRQRLRRINYRKLIIEIVGEWIIEIWIWKVKDVVNIKFANASRQEIVS